MRVRPDFPLRWRRQYVRVASGAPHPRFYENYGLYEHVRMRVLIRVAFCAPRGTMAWPWD